MFPPVVRAGGSDAVRGRSGAELPAAAKLDQNVIISNFATASCAPAIFSGRVL
jgi:hypothetical protein